MMKYTSNAPLLAAAFTLKIAFLVNAIIFDIDVYSGGWNYHERFSGLSVTPGTTNVADWYNLGSGSARTPQGYEKVNSNKIGIVIYNDTSDEYEWRKDYLSLVVIYDAPQDGSGGEAMARVTCDEWAAPAGCDAVGDDQFFHVHDDRGELLHNDNPPFFKHKWAKCCTDGFATRPLRPAVYFCVSFQGTRNLDGIRFYEPDGTTTDLLTDQNPDSFSVCLDVNHDPSKVADESCEAVISLESAIYLSHDPDCDSELPEESDCLSLSANTSSPYPLGDIGVRITLTDKRGGRDTCDVLFNVRDVTPPTVKLRGENPVLLQVGKSYNERGFRCFDNCDAKRKKKKTGTVDIGTVGEYRLTYKCTDDADNESETTRTVVVHLNCLFGHFAWPIGGCYCKQGPTPQDRGYCLNENGICSIAVSWDPVSGEYYCGATPPAPRGCTDSSECGSNNMCVDKNKNGVKVCVTASFCVYGTWNESDGKCDCIGGTPPAASMGYCEDATGACTIPMTPVHDFSSAYPTGWKFVCPGYFRRLSLRSEEDRGDPSVANNDSIFTKRIVYLNTYILPVVISVLLHNTRHSRTLHISQLFSLFFFPKR